MIFIHTLQSKLSLFLLVIALSLYVTQPLVEAQNTEKELFLVAQKAFDDGFYDVATRYINQLLEQYPWTTRQVQAKILLGQCYFFKKQYLKAYDIFQKLLAHNEFKDATFFWLGETYLKGFDYRQAEHQYQQLIRLFPGSAYTPQAYYSLGWSYFEQEKFVKAKEIFSQLTDKFPTHQLTEDAVFKLGEIKYNTGRYEETIDYFEKYVARYPKSTRHADTFFYIAESYYYLGDSLSAATYYAKVSEFSYDNKLILMSKVSLGWCYLKLKKYKLAEQYFEEAMTFSQAKGILSDDVFLGQASLFAEIGEYEKAMRAYDELIKNFPDSRAITETYLGKANTYYQLKNFKDTITTYKLVIDRYTNGNTFTETVEKAYFGLAWSFLKSGNIDLAIKNFEAIKDKASNKIVKISALTQIGDAYQDVEEYEKAVEVYDYTLKSYPDSVYTDYVQYRQGVALLKMGKVEAATLSFQSLQANFPNSKYLNDIKYYLAVAYFKKSDWAMAKKHIQTFIKSSSKNSELLAETYYILGLCRLNLGEYNKALKSFHKIIKNFPAESRIIKNAKFNTAKTYYKMGNIKEGLKRFKILLNKYPDTEIAQESLIWLGNHFLKISDFDTAIIYYTQFIDHFPGSEKINAVRYELGLTYEVKHEYNKAVEILKQITDTADRDIHTKAKLAIADIFSKEFDPQSAIQIYMSIADSSPEFRRDAYIKIANVHKNSGEYDLTIDAFKKALYSKAGLSQFSSAELQFYIAEMFEETNRLKQAVDEYFKVPYLYLDQKKWIAKAYLRIARIFEDSEQWDQAKITYQKIVDSNSDEKIFAKERLDWIAKNIL